MKFNNLLLYSKSFYKILYKDKRRHDIRDYVYTTIRCVKIVLVTF